MMDKSDLRLCMFILLLVVLCGGKPDIIDGLAKYVNSIDCEQTQGAEGNNNG